MAFSIGLMERYYYTNDLEIESALFGGHKIAVHRPLHSGFGAFSLHLYGQISNTAIAKHGLMALFQTFSHPDRYALANDDAYRAVATLAVIPLLIPLLIR